MFELIFSRDAEKFFRNVPDKHKKQISLKIIELQNKEGVVHDRKQLKGTTYLRTDVGEYRIIYEIEDEDFFIALIGKRKDDEVYKRKTSAF
jgi:mRNA interferase RelE/StbE